MTRGLVGNIGRYAVHDGPGIRTTVFLKGCPLHCPWCHNPELMDGLPEIAFYPERCLGCGECATVCSEGAVDFPDGAGTARLNRRRCSGCGRCAEICPAAALRPVGQWYTVEGLAEVILRDRLYYRASGGGVTLSGGEPTGQLPFVGLLLQWLKKEGLHTAIQTCGLFPWEAFAEIALDLLDLIFFDLKIADPAAHEALLGKGNRIILANLRRLLAVRPERVVVRIPLVPGLTATEENIGSLADFLKDVGANRIALLPVHPWGKAKAGNIGKELAETLPDAPMLQAETARWRRYFTWADSACC